MPCCSNLKYSKINQPCYKQFSAIINMINDILLLIWRLNLNILLCVLCPCQAACLLEQRTANTSTSTLYCLVFYIAMRMLLILYIYICIYTKQSIHKEYNAGCINQASNLLVSLVMHCYIRSKFACKRSGTAPAHYARCIM